MDNRWLNVVREKRVLFITTKNLSYLRNVQEIELLSQQAKKLDILGSDAKAYPERLKVVYTRFLKMIKQETYDVVFFGFAPQLMLPLIKKAKEKGSAVILDFFISLYDTIACDRKYISPHGFLARELKRIDANTLNLADAFLADTKEHKNYFVKEFGANADKGEVLYLKADNSIYHPMQVSRPQSLVGKFVVFYFGSVLPLQGVDVILKASRKCLDDPNICFIFVGPLGKKKKIKKEEYPNIRFYEWLSQPELAKQIAMADICLAGHFNAEIAKASRTIAGKTYIYKAMGKPVILGDNAANRELYIPKEKENYFVKMGDPAALAELILELAKEKENE